MAPVYQGPTLIDERKSMRLKLILLCLTLITLNSSCQNTNNSNGTNENTSSGNNPTSSDNAILFVTQVPIPGNTFSTIISNFANHVASAAQAPRGGDLWIRYADGSLRNLTAAAGFGTSGQQGDTAIAVREPSIHWDGNKALFSMVIGAPAEFEQKTFFWQIYEITGFGIDETVSISKVPNQPVDYNNVSPIYAPENDDIIFVSDKTHGGRHLYPQLDEYESTQTNTGLFRLSPTSGSLKRLTHAPSGDFTPIIDSFGRLVFNRWDHLQRDQQAEDPLFGTPSNFTDESNGATAGTAIETFPENRSLSENGFNRHTFNHFFLWEANPGDGSDLETLNHLGRQELHLSYTEPNLIGDDNLEDITVSFSRGLSANTIKFQGDGGTFHPKEHPNMPGRFYVAHMGEFELCGELISLDAVASTNPQDVTTNLVVDTSAGCWRHPLPLSNDSLLASHADGGLENGLFKNTFRLRFIVDGNPSDFVTTGINKQVAYYDPDTLIEYDGPLWELDPVEVAVRTRPQARTSVMATPEQEACITAFGNECDSLLQQLKDYLISNNLAIVVSRNVTRRDEADFQQPFNLNISGGVSSSTGQGTEYTISHLQLLQANLVRGYDLKTGRRPIAQNMDDSLNASTDGKITLGLDGSVAAFVPAGRALSWQLLAPDGTPVVRERYWVSFAPGEIRSCSNCHGINKQDHLGEPKPSNTPEALIDLFTEWKNSL